MSILNKSGKREICSCEVLVLNEFRLTLQEAGWSYCQTGVTKWEEAKYVMVMAGAKMQWVIREDTAFLKIRIGMFTQVIPFGPHCNNIGYGENFKINQKLVASNPQYNRAVQMMNRYQKIRQCV